MRYKKTDYLLFAVLVCAILALSLMALDGTCYWGDDWAAYISEGIAIAEGRLDEQAALNVIMHPSELPDEALGGSLVYVWGYPLLMALVYKLVGFDRVAFSSIIYYKIPSAIALALLAGVMYLFLRRRVGKTLSFLLSFLFCACYEFRVTINTPCSDIVFLFLAFFSLLMVEVFLAQRDTRRRIGAGIALGLVLWLMYETRLNGISILFACGVACVVYFVRSRREKAESFRLKNELAVILLPFALFLVMKLISEAILAPATSNTSDLAGVTVANFFFNLATYYRVAGEWLVLIFDDPFVNWLSKLLCAVFGGAGDAVGGFCFALSQVLVALTFLLALVGLVLDGFKREAHLTVFVLVYLFVVCMLPYNQGVRYIYPVLMLVPLYLSHALVRLARLGARLLTPKDGSIARSVGAGLAIALCVLCFASAMRNSAYKHAFGDSDASLGQAYDPYALESYHYIMDNTPPDALIGFVKPRALYLNTGRVSVYPYVNGHSLDDVDYCLYSTHFPDRQFAGGDGFEAVFANEEFVLYEKIKD